MEKCSAVGTAGVMQETASGEEDDYIGEEDHEIYRSVCGRLQFASPRRPDLLFTLKELGSGLAKPMKSSETVLVHMSEEDGERCDQGTG
eukprot:3144527-Amphidinium_carterae.1